MECELAKENIRDGLNAFYETYFYDLQLEVQICDGLGKVLESEMFSELVKSEPKSHQVMMEAVEGRDGT